MESTKTSKSWGGAREGAGRKTKDPSAKKLQMAIYLTPDQKERLQAAASREGVTISELIARWPETL